MAWLRRGIIVLLALVVAGLGLAIWRLNDVAASVLESQGTAALGVETTIDFISIGFLPPSLRFGGLEVENPEGFMDDNFLELGGGALDVDFGTLLGPTVHARSLQVEDIAVSLQRGLDRSNYGVILGNVKREPAAPPPRPAERPVDRPARTFRIDEIVLRDVAAHLVIDLPGRSQSYTVSVPEIRLAGVGTGPDGPASAGEVFSHITVGVLRALAGQGALPLELATDLGRALLGLPRFAVSVTGDVLRTGSDALGQAGRGAADLVQDAAGATVEGAKKVVPGD